MRGERFPGYASSDVAAGVGRVRPRGHSRDHRPRSDEKRQSKAALGGFACVSDGGLGLTGGGHHTTQVR